MALMFKHGVAIEKLTPQLVLGLAVAGGVWEANGFPVCRVTSIYDGAHGVRGKHPEGNAADLGTRELDEVGKSHTDVVQMLVRDLSTALPEGFDVLAEDIGGAHEHIHMEYDPK